MQVEIPRFFSIICVAGLSLALGGCSSIIEGASQDIAVATQPSDASCTITRDGHVFVVIPSTPGSIKVEQNANGIRIDCQKPGYETATHWVDSELAAAMLGNIPLGGVVGVVVDSASGAPRKCAGAVNIALARPVEASAPVAALPAIPTDSSAAVASAPASAPVPRPATSPQRAAVRTVTAEDRLRSLQDMLDRKAITPREFEVKRAAILAGN